MVRRPPLRVMSMNYTHKSVPMCVTCPAGRIAKRPVMSIRPIRLRPVNGNPKVPLPIANPPISNLVRILYSSRPPEIYIRNDISKMDNPDVPLSRHRPDIRETAFQDFVAGFRPCSIAVSFRSCGATNNERNSGNRDFRKVLAANIVAKRTGNRDVPTFYSAG